MINQMYVDMLVNLVKSGKITVEQIKVAEYKAEVIKLLGV